MIYLFIFFFPFVLVCARRLGSREARESNQSSILFSLIKRKEQGSSSRRSSCLQGTRTPLLSYYVGTSWA
jgi:hypothetical protein